MTAPSYSALDLRRYALKDAAPPAAIFAVVEAIRCANRGGCTQQAAIEIIDAVYGPGVIDPDDVLLSEVPNADFTIDTDGDYVEVTLTQDTIGLLTDNVTWKWSDGTRTKGIGSSHVFQTPEPWWVECIVEIPGNRWTAKSPDIGGTNELHAPEPAPEPEPAPVKKANAPDPAWMTVSELVNYAEQHPFLIEALLEAEKAGKNRVTAVDALEGLLG